MTTVSLAKAQAELPDLAKRALDGEDIVIAVDGQHLRLTRAPVDATFDEATAHYRGYGALKGKIEIGPEFFEPLSDEECGYGSSSELP